MDGLKAVPFKEFGFLRKLFSRSLIQSKSPFHIKPEAVLFISS